MSVANLEGCGRDEALSASLLVEASAFDAAAADARARFALAAARRAATASARRLRVDVRMATRTRERARGALKQKRGKREQVGSSP